MSSKARKMQLALYNIYAEDLPMKKSMKMKETLLFALTNVDEILFKKILLNLINSNYADSILFEIISEIFHEVARIGTPKMIANLISYGAKIDCPNTNGNTPLHCAIGANNAENVKYLLENNASILWRDKEGLAALHHAVKCDKNPEIILMILETRINPNVKDSINGNTPLHLLCNTNPLNYKIIKLLIEHGADINCRNQKGKTPFHFACLHGDLNVISYLIFKAGANIHLICESEETLLHFHITNKKVFELLLRQGINPNAKDNLGRTPLYHTIIWDEEASELLLHFGADINSQDKNGDTVFHYTLKYFYDTMLVIRLLEMNFNFMNTSNKKGETPFEYVTKTTKRLNPKFHSTATKVFISFIARKVKLEKSYVSEKHLVLIENDEEYNAFYKSCESELECLKRKINSRHSNVEFVDFLIKDINTLAGYCRNEELVEVLESDECLDNFVIYGKQLENCFNQSKVRSLLLEVAIKCFQNISKYKLSYTVVNKILCELSNIDLENIIKACSFPDIPKAVKSNEKLAILFETYLGYRAQGIVNVQLQLT